MKILYIASSPHGGSTLLSLVLGRHESAANLGELSFLPKLLALGEPCTCGERLSACPHWAPVFDSLRERHGVDLRADPYAMHFGDAIKDRHGSGRVDRAHQTRRRMILSKARGMIETAALFAAPSARLLDAMTPGPVRAGLENTLQLYRAGADTWKKNLVIDASKLPRKAPQLYLRSPDEVRVLHLTRDVRGVVASRMRYMSVERAAKRWSHYHALTRRIVRRWIPPRHRMRLRYEDFVADPEACLRTICGWLQMDYSPAMLDFTVTGTEHSAGGNPARFSIAGGIKPSDDKWKTLLDAEQLDLVERHAGVLNRAFGYE